MDLVRRVQRDVLPQSIRVQKEDQTQWGETPLLLNGMQSKSEAIKMSRNGRVSHAEHTRNQRNRERGGYDRPLVLYSLEEAIKIAQLPPTESNLYSTH